MRATVTVESRYVRTPDGAVWTYDGPAYRFFTDYLQVFDQVRVVARVRTVANLERAANRVDGPDVEVWPIPYYQGPRQYLQRFPAIRRAVASAASAEDAVILRVPSFIGSILAAVRDRGRLPYALDVMGDPHAVFAPGVVEHPLRPLLRQRYTSRLRHLCRSAVAVSYVTERYLQERYPAGPQTVTAVCSDVDLPRHAYADQARARTPGLPHVTLISVGSLDQMYKGIDTLLAAVARLRADGLAPRLVHVGDGRFRHRLTQLADLLGVAEQVTFTGPLPSGDAVRQQLDAADLFVMPSRTEGLPKALVEAMARGLPAVASAVGGIPELLPEQHLVAPDDAVGLAAAIRRLSSTPGLMTEASAENLTRARRYAAERLVPQRHAYFLAVQDAHRRAHRLGLSTSGRRVLIDP
ncbi:glycosyltransferase [Micromonospora sp. NPDC005686]|uniref:glycosyltransferase n=1 Tax=unclassified Micromonospora TaxID=2617518 RepID=UPI0033A8DEB1